MIFVYRFFVALCVPFYLLLYPFLPKKAQAWFKRPSNLKSSKLKSIWIHASSGEFEHAKPLIRELKKTFPYKKIVVTYSSPSYQEQILKNENIDAYEPYPFDLKGRIYELIKKINPEMVLFARTDLWPELMEQLKNKNIPSLVFARMESGKSNWLKKLHYKLTYKKASHISFVSEKDLENFKKTDPNHPSLSADGDPRVDEVFYRLQNLKKRDTSSSKQKTLILGSLWPEDYAVLKKSLLKALDTHLIEKLIIAPHELKPHFMSELKKDFKGFDFSIYSNDPDLESQVVLVDKMGVLFELYAQSNLAFVGGSFKKKVHSVLEPLSHGLVTLVGPHHENNSEAQTYKEKPYQFVTVVKSAKDFERELKAHIDQPNEKIQTTLKKQSGASIKLIRNFCLQACQSEPLGSMASQEDSSPQN